MKKLGKTITGFIGLCALYAASAVADDIAVVVSTDDSGNGDWRNKYGTCYSVVPWAPPTVFPEITVGPDFQGDNEGQYKIPDTTPKDAQCITAPSPEIAGMFDFRLYTDKAPGNTAFVWGFTGVCELGEGCSNPVRSSTPQWNACLGASGEFYPATWDSDDFNYDPLSAEVKLDKGGNGVVAFYFLSETNQCRSQKWTLSAPGHTLNGNPELTGTIVDLSIGKYLVFDFTTGSGLPEGGVTLRLVSENTDPANTTASCGGPSTQVGPNSHISGIFINDTLACAPPPGDAGCTPGFWKNTRKHLPAWVGYAPVDQFSSVFENDAFLGMTLKQVLKQGGGGLNALGRHTVAALLNGANWDINYGMSDAEVIAAFNEVYPGTKAEYTALKNEFADDNERGCPINGKTAPVLN